MAPADMMSRPGEGTDVLTDQTRSWRPFGFRPLVPRSSDWIGTCIIRLADQRRESEKHLSGGERQLRPARCRPHGESQSRRYLWARPIHDRTRRSVRVLAALGEPHEPVAAELYRPHRWQLVRRFRRREPSEPQSSDDG